MSRAEAKPRAILYLRQSTYREESISLELQETAGRDHCAKHGYVVVGVEADPGISGRTWKRPAVVRVMDMIESKQADVVVLWRWSRLSRSRKDWALAVDRIEVAGGKIESATEPNDVSASGRFARGVMTELSAFESERIGEQWREVHVNRVSRGLPSGRLPWGWSSHERGVAQNPEQAPAIPQLYDLYLSGLGSRQLAAWLEQNGYRTYYGKPSWSHSTVTAILDSPFHSGQITYRGELFPGGHEGLITVKKFQQYQAMRVERADERAPRISYLLSGLMKCACGGTMHGFSNLMGKRSKVPFYGYRCHDAALNPNHGPANISIKFIDPNIFAWLETVGTMSDPAPDYAAAAAKVDSQRFAREILAVDAQMSTLTQHLAQGIVPERAYRAAVADMESRREVLSDSLRAIESMVVLAPENPAKIAQSLVEGWPTVPLQTKRAVIRSLVSSIVIDFSAPRTLTIVPRWGAPLAMDV
ncbi:recombinase family protein [Cryobacterium psychrophilum]|uniref:Recombinase family protein n=1 Tax=Cryobacterium psychrophilum TaxID=41988 RepID=A0A4Y8KUN5_9MICO|nr:recombinase family protein [Cryobacterium psychrophilum]TDW30981.1 DNA invertase Pin-like site-specific DNA recombinase [Cryobacterium psychrophilum]TFD80845.1 recombinase family protein [Cryobacterium psychrophilum]